MIFYAYTAAALALLGVVCLFLTTPHGPDGEGPLQIFFLWAFRTFGTAARDIRKFVKDVNSLYLRRFYVSPRSLARFLERQTFWAHPSKIFLHHILRSDDDRDSHDHPWRFVSLILWGSYREKILHHFECVGDGPWFPVYHDRVARVGSILRNRAQHTHRVEIIRPVWSLVFAWPARRVWGFWTQEDDAKRTPKWVPWRTYLGIPTDSDSVEDVVGLPDPDAKEGIPLIRIRHNRIGSLIGTALERGVALRPEVGTGYRFENGREIAEPIYSYPVTDRSEDVTKRENMKDVLARSVVANLGDESVTVVTTYEGLRETARRIALAVDRKGE